MEPLTPDDPTSVGAYRLLGRLGRGGMGRVYLGRSAGGRTVAVKLVHAHIAVEQRFRTRFAREVAAARLVGGDWTAPVLDADPEAEVPWVATGYVAGPDLERAVGAHGALPERTVRALGAGLAEGLAAVHARGLVHRDVKPSNVLLALDGPRLIDFGIARATEAGATTQLTATGVSVGSPGYMSPEQALGEELGPATDVFSLGAVLAFAAGGRPPFPGAGVAQLLYRVVHEPPELATVPEALRPVVAACLEKRPAARPAPAEVARACAGAGNAADLLAAGWLPQPLVEEVSRLAVRLLDLDAGGAAGPGAPGNARPDPRVATPATPPAPGTGAGTPADGYRSPYPPDRARGPATPPSTPSPPSGTYGPSGAHGASGTYGTPPNGGTAVGTSHPAGTPVAGGPGGPARQQPPSSPSPRRRSRRLPLAVLATVLVVAAAGGAAWLLRDGEEPADAEAVPEEYLGTWVGDTRMGGLTVGSMVVEVSEGRVGEVVGTAAATDAIGLATCLDRLTLTAVADGELTFEAELDPERSTLSATCVSHPFDFVLRPTADGGMTFNGYADGDETEGSLRPGE